MEGTRILDKPVDPRVGSAQERPADTQWARESFDAFYRSYAAVVYRHVYFRVGLDDAASADITGEVFLAAWSQTRPAEEEALQLLYGIARRKVADFYRSKLRRREVRFSDLDEADRTFLHGLLAQAAPSGTQDSPRLSAAAREMLGQALTALESETQDLLLDKYVRGNSIQHMAERLGKSETATMSLLARARQKLRDALELRMRDEETP